ncbi:MAG: AMP-binding protein, partial [Polaribacter sp.]
MKKHRFHTKFQLNAISFSSVDKLLKYACNVSPEISLFLENWFSDDKVITVQTSGSTGKPKPIQLQKKHIVYSALATGVYFNLPQNTTALLCLPIKYIAGKMMLVRALVLGWKIDVVPPNSSPLKNVKKRYNFTAMVPLQVENSIEYLQRIDLLIIGGGAVSNQLQEKLQHINTNVFATYGTTETITHIAAKRLNNFSNISSSKVQKSFYATLPNVTIYKDERNCL